MDAKRIRLLPQAERDINEETVYLADEAGAEIGIRFFDSAHATLRSLLEMPGMGKKIESADPKIPNIRQWPVSGFEKYLIFYQPSVDGIDVVRVLHGARDIRRIFEDES